MSIKYSTKTRFFILLTINGTNPHELGLNGYAQTHKFILYSLDKFFLNKPTSQPCVETTVLRSS